MSEEGRETPRTGHIYDEIEELDHPVPRWFQGLFYSTVVFGLVYLFYYTLGGGPSLLQEYQQDRTADEIATHEMLIKGGGPKLYTEAELLAFFKEPDRKERGDASFKSKCASCHGNQGQGGIGPNLTDSYWLHGGKHTEILTSILKGVPDKGMPPWEALVTQSEAVDLVAYIDSIYGSKPAEAKEPQGELVKTGK